MDKVILDDLWNLSLNSATEEYGTSDNSASSASSRKFGPEWWMGVGFAMIFVMIWPIIAQILLKLVGIQLVVVPTSDYELVNSTLFRWTFGIEEARAVSGLLMCIIFTYFFIFF